MEIFKFISYMWRNSSAHTKILILFLSFVVAFIISLCFGISGVLVFVALVLSFLMFVLGRFMYLAIKSQWSEYKIYREEEAQRIINRLRGNY